MKSPLRRKFGDLCVKIPVCLGSVTHSYTDRATSGGGGRRYEESGSEENLSKCSGGGLTATECKKIPFR